MRPAHAPVATGRASACVVGRPRTGPPDANRRHRTVLCLCRPTPARCRTGILRGELPSRVDGTSRKAIGLRDTCGDAPGQLAVGAREAARDSEPAKLEECRRVSHRYDHSRPGWLSVSVVRQARVQFRLDHLRRRVDGLVPLSWENDEMGWRPRVARDDVMADGGGRFAELASGLANDHG